MVSTSTVSTPIVSTTTTITTTTSSSSTLPTSILHKKKKYTLDKQHHSPLLANQLAQLEFYWTHPNNLLRKNPKVNQVTHNKRKERILCFMGWCKDINNVIQPDLTLFDVNKSEKYKNQYETYLNYLKETRKLTSGTMVEHFTAAIYVLKYLFAKYA